LVGVLLSGFRNGVHYARNRVRLESFLANRFVEFLPVNGLAFVHLEET
jgi:hypothetical protein